MIWYLVGYTLVVAIVVIGWGIASSSKSDDSLDNEAGKLKMRSMAKNQKTIPLLAERWNIRKVYHREYED